MLAPWYATREACKAALEVAETARSDAAVDRALESASRAVEGELRRRFYPLRATRTFDWPQRYTRPWTLEFGQHELSELTVVVAGGVTLDTDDVLARPDHGPPFDRIEVDLSSSAMFAAADTNQRAVAVTGVWNYPSDTVPAGQLADAVNDTATTVVVDGPAAAAVGVGSLLLAGTERLIVADRRMVDTGVTLDDDLPATHDTTAVTVTDGSGFAAGELVLVDAERMRVVDVAGDVLVVERAYDGSVLASHTAGAAVYASRQLTVHRGVLGTAAASHSQGAALTLHTYPGPVVSYTLALAIDQLLQERAGYGRTAGGGDSRRDLGGGGLPEARARARKAYGRHMRLAAV